MTRAELFQAELVKYITKLQNELCGAWEPTLFEEDCLHAARKLYKVYLCILKAINELLLLDTFMGFEEHPRATNLIEDFERRSGYPMESLLSVQIGIDKEGTNKPVYVMKHYETGEYKQITFEHTSFPEPPDAE